MSNSFTVNFARAKDVVDEVSKNLTTKKPKSSDIEIPLDFIKFNELIGLPEHPATHQQQPLMPFQIDFHNQLENGKHKKFHVNKSRQIGFTEICVRELLYSALTRYKEGLVAVIAGTRVDTTKFIMSKFTPFLNKIPNVLNDRTDLHIRLRNGVEIIGYPSNSASLRGLSKVRAVFMDEAAHFELIDDSVVLDAIMPIVETNQSELIMISTPNGPRGFFYDVDMEQNEYFKIKHPIYSARGYLYSDEQIQAILSRKDVDVEQEYLNQYTTTRNAVFGSDFKVEEYVPEQY